MKRRFPTPDIVIRDGRPVAVIIPIEAYEEILERLEDTEDVAYLNKARKKVLHYRPLAEYLSAT